MMKGSGCEKCPVKDCPTLIYRGSFCEALRASHGLSDPMTNADHIRAMSDEELCEFILEIRDGDCLNDRRYVNDPHKGCDDCTLEWLKQPYKENE